MGICCMAQETQRGALYQPRGVGWGGRWERVSKGRDICIPMTDSCWGLTEKIIKNKLIFFKNLSNPRKQSLVGIRDILKTKLKCT